MFKLGWQVCRKREPIKLSLMETLARGTSVWVRSERSIYHFLPRGVVVGIYRAGPGRTVPIGKVLDASEWYVAKMTDGYDHFWVIERGQTDFDEKRVFDAKIIKWDTKPIR